MSSTPAPPTTFADQWRASVGRRTEAGFLRFEASTGTVSTWTYGELDAVVERVAGRLRRCGAGRERGVHLALTNSPAFVAIWLAATRLGSWIVPSDPMATAPELAEHMARTRPAVSVVGRDRRAVADAACGESVDGVVVGDLGIATIAVDEDGAELEPLLGDPVADDSTIEPTDRAAIMFTSGTTGRPKGVVVTQGNYAFAGATMATACGLLPEHRHLVVLPMFHANAQYYSFASAVAVGAGVALMHTFSASGFLRQASDHDATHASLFAGPMRMILARATPDPDRPVGLQHCWYAQNITDDQYDTLTAWFGCRPRQLYGMTETIPAVLSDRPGDPRPDSIGTPTAGCVVALHDGSGRPVPDGDVGEIVVGGTPGLTLFAGYLDDPVTTDRSYRDGWFRTGDRARVAADGRWEFDGRSADVLKVAGENVSIVEVESVVAAHPAVFEAVVVGAHDPIRDEVPVAFVVPTADARGLDHDELAGAVSDWCAARLSKSKRPRLVTVVDEVPRTSVGKVRKFLLADAADEAVAAAPASITPAATRKET